MRKTITVTAFGFDDPLDNPKNNFMSVIIKRLPTSFALTLNNVAVVVDQVISVMDIANGLLVMHQIGQNADSFDFMVQDDGGTDRGGVDTSLQHTMYFTPYNAEYAMITSKSVGAHDVIFIVYTTAILAQAQTLKIFKNGVHDTGFVQSDFQPNLYIMKRSFSSIDALYAADILGNYTVAISENGIDGTQSAATAIQQSDLPPMLNTTIVLTGDSSFITATFDAVAAEVIDGITYSPQLYFYKNGALAYIVSNLQPTDTTVTIEAQGAGTYTADITRYNATSSLSNELVI